MESIILEVKEGVAIITVSRPKQLNALDEKTIKELDNALDIVSGDENAKVVIVTGAGGKAFVAGADIAAMAGMSQKEAENWSRLGNSVFLKLEKLNKPTIAAVNGFALGGGMELMMACDMRIAAVGAKFGQPEITLGVIPGFGGTQRLARLVGASMAKRLCFTGEMIGAEEALRIGAVNSVVPGEALMDEAVNLAKKIASFSGEVLKSLKQAIDEGRGLAIEEGLMLESGLFGALFEKEDQKTRMNAFLERNSKKN